jgi:hypothetical protein
VSFREQLLKPLKDDRDGLRRKATEPANKAFGIDCPKLVQDDEASSALKATRYSPWICPPAGRHRRDDHCV